jgi:hypothetical protein
MNNAAVEAGKVLYFPQLSFQLTEQEKALLRSMCAIPRRAISAFNVDGSIKGVAGDEATQAQVAGMVRALATRPALIAGLFPPICRWCAWHPPAPSQVETRAQSWRADDKRMHVDAFPSRPNYGERILRVFTNVNPDGQPVWRGRALHRCGQAFCAACQALQRLAGQGAGAAACDQVLSQRIRPSMLQLHDGMKGDPDYQKMLPRKPCSSRQVPPGCVSDQAVHAVMSGQYMLEQTLFLPPGSEYNPAASPLSILSRMKGHPLVDAKYR